MEERECDPTCAPHLFQFCSPECEQRFKAEGDLEGIPVNERDYDANEAWFA